MPQTQRRFTALNPCSRRCPSQVDYLLRRLQTVDERIE